MRAKDVQEFAAVTGHNLGSLGNSGAHPQNCDRDIFNRMKKLAPDLELEPADVDLLFFHRDGSMGGSFHKFPIFYPHGLIWCLFAKRQHTFRSVFFQSEDKLKEYWAKRSSEEWFREHPARNHVLRNPAGWAPVRIHGDDANVKNNVSGLLLSISSPLAWMMTSLLSVFPLFFLISTHLVPGELERLYSHLAWSIDCLLTGFFPSTDIDGQPFPENSFRGRMAGKTIAGGLRFLVSEIVGDWKYLKEAFHLSQSYAHNLICLVCNATKKVGPMCYSNVNDDADYRNSPRSHMDYMMEFLQNGLEVPRMASFIGFHMRMIRFDFMHTFLLGTWQFSLSSAFIFLLERDFFGKFWGNTVLRHSLQLRAAWHSFKKFNKALMLTCVPSANFLPQLRAKSKSTF